MIWPTDLIGPPTGRFPKNLLVLFFRQSWANSPKLKKLNLPFTTLTFKSPNKSPNALNYVVFIIFHPWISFVCCLLYNFRLWYELSPFHISSNSFRVSLELALCQNTALSLSECDSRSSDCSDTFSCIQLTTTTNHGETKAANQFVKSFHCVSTHTWRLG